MAQWLDEHRDLLNLVTRDLRRHGVKGTGRESLLAEAVLRCALLKQYRQLSYQELAFHLEDSASFRAFARLSPKKSVLHKTISAIRAETWEDINRVLLASARQDGVETDSVMRLDSTVTAALIHEPSDSSLLWDAVRVMVRLLQQADALGSGPGRSSMPAAAPNGSSTTASCSRSPAKPWAMSSRRRRSCPWRRARPANCGRPRSATTGR